MSFGMEIFGLVTDHRKMALNHIQEFHTYHSLKQDNWQVLEYTRMNDTLKKIRTSYM